MDNQNESNEMIGKVLRKFLSALADRLNDQVILKVILQALPILWTTFVAQFWRSSFYTSSGSLNAIGGLIAVLLSLVSIFLLILTGYKSKKDKLQKNKLDSENTSFAYEIELRKAISSAENTLEEVRNRTLRQWANNNILSPDIHVFVNQARNPTERINTALDGLRECFAQVSKIDKSRIFLSAAIAIVNTNSTKKPDWNWMANPPMEGTATINDLVNSNSSFKVVEKGEPFFYANEKAKAEKEGKYIFDGRDESYDRIGSIVCYEVSEEIGKWRIRLIISISTYGEKLIGPEDEKEGVRDEFVYQNVIRDTIFKQFEGIIKEDLLWCGIENMGTRKK